MFLVLIQPETDEATYEEVCPALPTRHPIKEVSIPQTAAQQPTNILPAAKDTKHQGTVSSPTNPTAMPPKSLQLPTAHEKTGFFSKQFHKIKTIGEKLSVERDNAKASTQTTLKDIPTDSIRQVIPVLDTESSKAKLIAKPHKPFHKPPVDLPHTSFPSTNSRYVAPKTHMDYQNTMLGGVTIKPMVKAKFVEDMRAKAVDETGEECKPYEPRSEKQNTYI